MSKIEQLTISSSFRTEQTVTIIMGIPAEALRIIHDQCGAVVGTVVKSDPYLQEMARIYIANHQCSAQNL